MRIKEPVAMSDHEEKAIRNKWTAVIDDAKGELNTKGFFVPEKPDFSPELLTKDNLIGTSPEAYAKLYTEHLHWYNYAAPYMAEIRATLSGTKTALNDMETTIRDGIRRTSISKEDKLTVQELKDVVWLDPRYQELQLLHQKYEQMKDMMSAHMDIMDRNMKLISRIEEERKVEFSGERRSGNVGHSRPNDRFRGR